MSESIEEEVNESPPPTPPVKVAEEVPDDAQGIANELLYDLLQETVRRADKEAESPLYERVPENDQFTAFIESTLGALADDIEMGAREYIPHTEIYYWMTYFFLQFCGFRIFLANIDVVLAAGGSVSDCADIIVELVDNVAENADYLHFDSDLPEHVARSVMWSILNSSMLSRRYNDMGVAYWQSGDILDDILERVFTMPPAEEEEEEEVVEVVEKEVGVSLDVKKSRIKADEQKFGEPAVCREFGGIFRIAEDFVDELIQNGVKEVEARVASDEPVVVDEAGGVGGSVATSDGLPSLIKSDGHIRPFMLPTIQSFTVRVGRKSLFDLIARWNRTYLLEDWAYSVKFLIAQSDACSDFYFYEVKMGLPTALYPVAQATCSLLFTIEVSRVKPPVCAVNMTFKIEGSGYVHTPNEYEFQESWLLNVINSKLKLFKRVHF